MRALPNTAAWRRDRPPWVWVAVVLLLGGLASAGAGAILHRQQRQNLEAVMDRRAYLIADTVTAQAARYVDTLRTVAGSVGAFDTLTARKFAQAAAPVAQLGLAGGVSLAYQVAAGDGQVAAVQAKWRSRGSAGLTLKPDRRFTEHLFSVFAAGLDGTTPALAGSDVAANPVPAAALAQAYRTGRVTISDSYVLARDRTLPAAHRPLSFVLTAALYGPADSRGHRPFRGWLSMGLRGGTFLGDSLTRIAQSGIDVTMLTTDPDGRPVAVATLRSPVGGVRDLRRTVVVPVAQDHWTLAIASPAGTLPGTDGLPAAVTVAGLVLTAALAVLVYSLATGRARARHAVEVATAGLIAQEAVLRQQKADLTAFAGVVAHDLKAPLATVLAYTECLREDLGGGEADPAIEKITTGVARMGTLIDDLLTYAAAREGGVQPVDLDLHALAGEVAIAHLDAASAARRPLPTIYIGNLPAVAADPALIRQLLHNLIGNAIKYTPPGQAPRIDVTAGLDGDDTVLVQIADRGLGIPEGHHQAIFNGFHRAHAATGIPGTGLGLAICHRIVERHHGTIVAADNPGGGTIITFTLPRAAAEPGPADIAPGDVQRPAPVQPA